MIIGKNVKMLMMVFLACILLEGTALAAVSQEETVATTEQNQSGVSEENASASEMHTIQIISNSLSPETIEINQSDTVVWRNLNRPKGTFVLVSKDNLWENYSLGYGKSFSYTFNETGTFNFSVEDGEVMEGTVVVKERTEVTPEEVQLPQEEQESQIQQEQAEEQNTSESVEGTSNQTEEEQTSENFVIILDAAFSPEAIDLSKGESLTIRNLSKPKRSFVLVSEENLFEDTVLGYGKIFTYVFDKSGTYTFKLENVSDTQLVATVK